LKTSNQRGDFRSYLPLTKHKNSQNTLWIKQRQQNNDGYVKKSAHIDKLLIADSQLHGSIAVIQSIFPGMQQEDQTQLSGRVARQRIFDRYEVLQ